MKTIEQIAEDCGMNAVELTMLRCALSEVGLGIVEDEDRAIDTMLVKIYRRIEKLEEELKTLGLECDKLRLADGMMKKHIANAFRGFAEEIGTFDIAGLYARALRALGEGPKDQWTAIDVMDAVARAVEKKGK